MSSRNRSTTFRDYSAVLVILGVFYTLALAAWLLSGAIFYLVNFILIGTSIGLGMGFWPVLTRGRRDRARQLSQALVGGYMFLGLGLGLIYTLFGVIAPENMQIEGFLFWLLAGEFAAAVIHYTVAKIIGPFIFNRGWCGWACWTAAILDFLPWKRSSGRLPGGWGHLRYGVFCLSASLVLFSIYLLGINLKTNFGFIDLTGKYASMERTYQDLWLIPELWWFLVGNLLYYGAGIGLAITLSDNRAFCKYLCPITVFLKFGAKFSLLKIRADPQKCTVCGACETICPMDIEITRYMKMGERVGSSECIFCFKCINACPEGALSVTKSADIGRYELLRTREPSARSKSGRELLPQRVSASADDP